MSEYRKREHHAEPDGHAISGQGWGKFFRERQTGNLTDTPVNAACMSIYDGLDADDQQIMCDFYIRNQTPIRYTQLTGVSMNTLMPILRRNEAQLLRELGF